MKNLDKNTGNMGRVIDKETIKEITIPRFLEEKSRPRKEEEKKKPKSKKRIAKDIAIFSLGVLATTASVKLYQYEVGKNAIIKEFDSKTSFHRDNQSYGFQIYQGTTRYNYYDGIKAWVEEARANGMSDQEISVAISCELSSDAAETGLGEENFSDFGERIETCNKAYYKQKLK